MSTSQIIAEKMMPELVKHFAKTRKEFGDLDLPCNPYLISTFKAHDIIRSSPELSKTLDLEIKFCSDVVTRKVSHIKMHNNVMDVLDKFTTNLPPFWSMQFDNGRDFTWHDFDLDLPDEPSADQISLMAHSKTVYAGCFCSSTGLVVICEDAYRLIDVHKHYIKQYTSLGMKAPAVYAVPSSGKGLATLAVLQTPEEFFSWRKFCLSEAE